MNDTPIRVFLLTASVITLSCVNPDTVLSASLIYALALILPLVFLGE